LWNIRNIKRKKKTERKKENIYESNHIKKEELTEKENNGNATTILSATPVLSNVWSRTTKTI
jgi:hypothetical protein